MRTVPAHVTDLSAVKEWFDRLGKPAWTLVSNFHDSIPANSKGVIFRQADQDMDMEESWGWLETLISQQSPGSRLTLFVATNPTGNICVSQKYQHGAAAPIWGPYGGMPGVAGYPMVGAAQVTQEVERARREWEMEKKIEELEQAINQPAVSGLWGVVQQKLQEVDPNTLMEVLGSALGGLMGLVSPMLTPRATVQGNPALDNDAPEGEAPPYQFEADRIIPILVTIRKEFSTDEEFYAFVGALAAKFSEKPDFYKMMLK